MVVRPLGYSWPGLLAAAGVGLLVYNLVFHYFVPIGQFAYARSSDRGGVCPWPRTLLAAFDNARLERLMGQRRRHMEVVERDFWLPIEKVRSGKGDFWLRRGGLRFDAPGLLAYLQAEHEWLADSFSEHSVRLNDIVLDVGAHVGVFTRVALDRGAAKVIALEPEPVNAECFRRNFKREIGEGRVVLVEKAAWSKMGKLPFALGTSNSGTSSMVVEEPGATRIQVPADTIDHILEVLEIRKVHFVKMDIEGAEREALKGALDDAEAPSAAPHAGRVSPPRRQRGPAGHHPLGKRRIPIHVRPLRDERQESGPARHFFRVGSMLNHLGGPAAGSSWPLPRCSPAGYEGSLPRVACTPFRIARPKSTIEPTAIQRAGTFRITAP